jgi:hypothetical protein
VPVEHDRLTRLYDIAAFERPLTDVERVEAGFDARLSPSHIGELYEIAALERPLGESELREIEIDLSPPAAA